MLFRIDPAIFEVFPDVRIGVVCAHGLDNRGDSAEITARIRRAETNLVEAFEGASVTEHPRIAPWREAYRRFGAKPKKYPSSIENLARRALKGDKLRPINKLVDIYNSVSLRHVMPVGGEDLDRIEGDIVLTYAGESEVPVKLLGESEERPPVAGEIIYKDGAGAICRRWNWKEADRTKLTEETLNAVLVIESLPPIGLDELETASGELADLIKNHCGGKTLVAILDSQRSSVELSSP